MEATESEAARAHQERLAQQIRLEPMPANVRWLAAMDVAYGVGDDVNAYGAVVLVERHSGELVGYVVRTQDGINPVFCSPGHLCTAEEAANLIMELRGEYRIPEPLRQAHGLSVRLRAGEVGYPLT